MRTYSLVEPLEDGTLTMRTNMHQVSRPRKRKARQTIDKLWKYQDENVTTVFGQKPAATTPNPWKSGYRAVRSHDLATPNNKHGLVSWTRVSCGSDKRDM